MLEISYVLSIEGHYEILENTTNLDLHAARYNFFISALPPINLMWASVWALYAPIHFLQ